MHLNLKPHETHITLPGPAGSLEAIVSEPLNQGSDQWALLCHPHPLQEGTMHNKVVTTLARTFDQLGISSIRFNYRGVGNSEGHYGDIIGECDDAQAVLEHMSRPGARWWYAGFSFGSYVAAYRASQDPHAQGLISLAPPIANMPFDTLPEDMPHPWLMVHGDADEVAPFDAAQHFAQAHPTISWLPMSGVGHFFHGQLGALKKRLLEQMSPEAC